MKEALCVSSGGQDSTTCFFQALESGLYSKVHSVTYNYGQRHVREIEAAKAVYKIATEEGLPVGTHFIIGIGAILVGSSPLVSQNKLEQYADMYSLPGGLEKTFVPGRNLLFLTLAANLAYSLGITDLVAGVCQEDSGGYPDCRQDFITATETALRLGLAYDSADPFTQLKIHTPLMDLSKAETVLMAKKLGPKCWKALGYTHTAYDGAYPPLGNDHATLLRAKGFEDAGLPDPLVLRAVEEGLMDIPATANYLALL